MTAAAVARRASAGKPRGAVTVIAWPATSGAPTIGTSGQLVRAADVNRVRITIQNLSAFSVDVGYRAGTSIIDVNPPATWTAATIPAGSEWIDESPTQNPVWVRCTTGTAEIRVKTELAVSS